MRQVGPIRIAAIFGSFVIIAGACGSSGNGNSGETADAAPGSTIDAAPGQPDAMPEDGEVRFIAMGDTGTGSQSQHDIGDAIGTLCADKGCDFVMLLGDNFYDSGVISVDDPLWQTYFELPYANVDAPFHPVLGNHDYGGEIGPLTDQGGIGNEFHKGPIEVQYSAISDKWDMPDTFYTMQFGNVGFMMLDTNSIMWNDTENGDQKAWYADARATLDGADWVFAAGHHPYRSNGKHGNAGSYESIEIGGVSIPIPLPIMDGENLKDFFDDFVCGNIDIYFAGHDHNRQYVEEPDALCGAPMIVSGAGAKTSDLEAASGERNTTLYQDDTEAGFAYVVVTGKTLTFQFLDADLNVDFEKTLTIP